MKTIRLNQTLIKVLKKGEVCPRQIKEIYIDGVRKAPSVAQKKGLIFEELCLDGVNTTVIPGLKTGGTPAEYIRIKEQADYFKDELIKEYSLDILDKDKRFIHLEAPWSEDVMLHGEIDFMSPIKDDVLGEIPMAIHDLKLTGSIYKQWGEFSWAFPFNLDHTQAYMYNWLVKKLTGYDMPFYYWVFDYSTDKNFKVFRKEISTMNKLEFEETVRMSVEKYKDMESNGWDIEKPSYDTCKECPLQNNCKSYNKKKTIEII